MELEAGAVEPEEEAEETTEAVAEGAEAADGAPAKKKTRRGSRGGRNRKKKPAAATDGTEPAEAFEQEADAEPSASTTPRIHVPDRELEEKPPARKRTPKPKPSAEEGEGEAAEQVAEAVAATVETGRRRGGAAEEEDAPRLARRPQPEEARGCERRPRTAPSRPRRPRSRRLRRPTNGAEAASDEYVPMTEWLDDLDAK